jgi:hypothetical protein
MSIDKVENTVTSPPSAQQQPKAESALIDSDEIKAILYLGIRGEISLPIEKHDVDILA